MSGLEARLSSTPVSEVMSRRVATVKPSDPLSLAAALMLERQIASVVVVDLSGKPIGMLTKTDLVREAHEGPLDTFELHAGRRVSDVMTENARAVLKSESLGRAAALLAAERLHHLPVLDTDGVVRGVLSTVDITRWVAETAGFAPPPRVAGLG